MTDFYAVLKKSIVKRDLRSPADRLEVYQQARKAMIQRLWSFDPPLAEDEIDARIGLFDAAVDRIEADLEEAYAERQAAEKLVPMAPAPRPPAPPRSTRRPQEYAAAEEDGADYHTVHAEMPDAEWPPVAYPMDEGPELTSPPDLYDRQWEGRQEGPGESQRERAEAAGYAAYEDEAAPPPRSTASSPAPSRHAPSRAAASRTAPLRPTSTASRRPAGPPWPQGRERRERRFATTSEAAPEPTYSAPAYQPAPVYQPTPAYQPAASYAAPAYEDAYADSYDEPAAPAAAPSYDADPAYAHDEDERPSRTPQREARRAERRIPARRRHRGEPYEEPEDDPPRFARTHQRRRPLRSGRAWLEAGIAEIRRHDPVRLLTWTIITLAAILILFNAYVFLPLLFESRSSPPAPEPSKVDDRMPSAALPGNAETRIAGDSATAVEIPERNLNVVETLVVFDGRDPTVFEAASGNPVQFDSDAEGGFTRISSSSSAAGARAVIGPGLASRLAGRTIRVTLLARSSPENGAESMRFAYQSGLAISHWQTAGIASNYGSYGMIWRVPAMRTSSADDYLLIEPGFPGAGTSADIRSIRIDILAS